MNASASSMPVFTAGMIHCGARDEIDANLRLMTALLRGSTLTKLLLALEIC
jgi:hypothetical protein